MATLQDQREGEAAGAVYCFGMGYGEDYQSHDRPFIRENLTVMTKLSGRGVHQVEAVRATFRAGARCDLCTCSPMDLSLV